MIVLSGSKTLEGKSVLHLLFFPAKIVRDAKNPRWVYGRREERHSGMQYVPVLDLRGFSTLPDTC